MKRIFLILALGLFALTSIAAATPEDVFWQSVNKTDLVEEYRLYLEQYPQGKYGSDARRRISQLEGKSAPPAAKADTEQTYQRALAAHQANDYKNAFPLMLKAAEQGHGNGRWWLGTMYEFGEGVRKDEAAAVRWYRKAAEQGNAEGQWRLGNMYKSGYGVGKDEAEAVRWYRKAAEQGNAAGQWRLGGMYKFGYGVRKDGAEAVRWFRKAAEQGNVNGQWALGGMYEFGEGVRKDEAEAVRWYRKAAEQGNENAKESLKSLGQ